MNIIWVLVGIGLVMLPPTTLLGIALIFIGIRMGRNRER